ncbi:hypothetical protein XELAEV_18017617mg [Xenopus laevis]|uniref:Uncharacterized protein n=1 Tax=Xenopus laevis TaxID=8355 RepID=A0A974DBH8_XENLA|nr:hypothetical protein XELAEV_18017617mg [Xenopus laevis]
MADHGWDGWPDPEAGSASNNFFLKDPLPDTSNKRYVWNGTFGEKYLTAECKVIVAYCGRCGAEGDRAFRIISSSCHVCGFGCWMGPLAVVEESPGPMVMSPAPPAQEKIFPRVPDVAAVTGNEPAPPACPSPMPRCSSPTAVGEEQASVAMGGISLDPPAKDAKPATRGRGRGCASSTLPRSTASTKGNANVSQPSSSAESSFLSIASPEPDCAEMDFGPLPTPSSSSDTKFFCYEPLPPKSPEVDNSFWVSPGRWIQRIINIKVYDQWGYYMPYAPEWVYGEMEKHLDEWIYGELLRKEGIGSGGLFHSDATKRERDLSFLSNVVHEWWYGRTILKHYVKSCGKLQEEKHFGLSELISSGGHVDKPHSNYYLSYEDTRARSCLGRGINKPSLEEV